MTRSTSLKFRFCDEVTRDWQEVWWTSGILCMILCRGNRSGQPFGGLPRVNMGSRKSGALKTHQAHHPQPTTGSVIEIKNIFCKMCFSHWHAQLCIWQLPLRLSRWFVDGVPGLYGFGTGIGPLLTGRYVHGAKATSFSREFAHLFHVFLNRCSTRVFNLPL